MQVDRMVWLGDLAQELKRDKDLPVEGLASVNLSHI